jgi:hypothetical protein
MLVDRSGWFPFVAVSARIAPSAQLAGDVRVGEIA